MRRWGLHCFERFPSCVHVVAGSSLSSLFVLLFHNLSNDIWNILKGMTLSTRTRITAAPPSPALSSRSRLWPLSLSQCQQQADSRMAQRPSFADALANTGLVRIRGGKKRSALTFGAA
ncbi:hypothetical protein K1719_034730, partial [Acacia pycnantha]